MPSSPQPLSHHTATASTLEFPPSRFPVRGAMDSDSTEVAFEAYGFRLYKDGHVVRSGREDRVAAGFDADTGVTSKDVVIDAATGVTARLYLPPIQTAPPSATAKLPVVVFFHGGYFIVGSPAEPMYHRYVNSLVATARVVAVSVGYRLAPENHLPVAYDDSWTGLTWAMAGADPWLADHGDLGRVFLVGVSAGGNATHNMALAAGVSGLPGTAAPALVEGVVLLHPSFSGEQKMEEEEEKFWRANNNRWRIIFPGAGATGGVDDPRINPTAAGAPSLAKLAGKRLLVCTASEDPRAPRAKAYSEAVRASGWHGEVEWLESEGEGHGFFVLNPGPPRAEELMDRVVAFIGGH
ncbi:hypothetical protein ACP4OV_007364 [Aristida adscensionis]